MVVVPDQDDVCGEYHTVILTQLANSVDDKICFDKVVCVQYFLSGLFAFETSSREGVVPVCFDASSQRVLDLVSKCPGWVDARMDRFQSTNNEFVLLRKILTRGLQMSSRLDVVIRMYASLIYASRNLDDCRLPVLNLITVGSWKAIRKSNMIGEAATATTTAPTFICRVIRERPCRAAPALAVPT